MFSPDSRSILASLLLVCSGACSTILLEALAALLGRSLGRRAVSRRAGNSPRSSVTSSPSSPARPFARSDT
jgi:hypothetical protein